MITVLLAAPFVAALLMLLASGRDREAALRLGLVLSAVLAAFGVAAVVGAWSTFDLPWLQVPGTSATVHFHVALDGLSPWLVLLVLVLGPAAVLGAAGSCGDRLREFVAALFAMQGALVGALLARDLVLFYVFFEAMLFPALLLVGLFGDPATRVRAAVRFLVYTMAGSMAMLVAIWYLASVTGSVQLTELPGLLASSGLADSARCWCFCAFALAFLVKTPVVPFHGWQAPLYATCPSAAAVLIAGAMAKMGPYGLVAIAAPLFPGELRAWAPVLITLGTVGVVYGALVALVQQDLRRLLAYSSLSHLGLIVVGIAVGHQTALAGVLVQMVAHGLAVGALFLLVGVLERRQEGCGLDAFGGLAGRTPVLAVLAVIGALAAVAVPGSVGFIGEVLLLRGTFSGLHGQYGLLTALLVTAAVGSSLILGAAYVLRWVQRIVYGQPREERVLDDLRPTEGLAIVPLLLLSVALGLFPAAMVRAATPAPAAAVADEELVAVPAAEPGLATVREEEP